MKNVILIIILFSGIANFAADKNQTTRANAELLCSWQYKTSYVSDGKICYFTTDNYYFYTDNTCVKVSTTNECTTYASIENVEYSRWIKTENNVVLLNKYGKQIAAFAAKYNSADLLKGQKVIAQTIVLPKQILIPSNDDQLAMNQ